jgi:hypothetical protein
LRAICTVGMALTPTGLHAQVTPPSIRTIQLTPGGASTILPVSVNQFGRLAFTQAASVWYVDLAGANQLRVFASAGGPVIGGRPGDTWRPPTSHPLFDSQNRLVGRTTLASTGEDSIVYGSPGQFLVLARSSLQAPGYAPGTTFARSGFGLPAMNAAGLVAFDARLSGNNEGVWYRQPGGPTTLLVGPDMQAPGFSPGVNINGALGPRLNASGQVVLEASVEGPGIDSTNDEVVYWGDPANPQLLLREGQSVAGSPLLESFYRPTIDDSGTLAVWATLQTPLTQQAIITGSATSMMPIARSGVRGPGMAPGETWGSNSDTTHFWYPVLTGSGNAVFWGQIAGSGGGGAGLWTGNGDSLTMVARTGSTVPGLPEGVSILGPSRDEFAANALGDIVLLASLTGPGVNSSNNTMLAYWNEDTGLEPLVRRGDLFEVAPGDFRAIASIEMIGNAGGEDGAPVSLNNRREFVWRMDFTNGTTGVFLTVVPSPHGAMVLLLGMGAALGRSRRSRTTK